MAKVLQNVFRVKKIRIFLILEQQLKVSVRSVRTIVLQVIKKEQLLQQAVYVNVTNTTRIIQTVFRVQSVPIVPKVTE